MNDRRGKNTHESLDWELIKVGNSGAPQLLPAEKNMNSRINTELDLTL